MRVLSTFITKSKPPLTPTLSRKGRGSFEKLERWDKTYLWHPFTQQTEWETREPVIIESGHGVWLRDIHRRRFLDGNSSLWVNVFGHNHPVLNRAIQKQLSKIAHATFLGLTHEPAIRLAKRLVELAPSGLTRVFYSDNGSTAVEVALKMAYQYWQLQGQPSRLLPPSATASLADARHSRSGGRGKEINFKSKFVSLKEGYHGDTLGSVSVGGISLFHERFRDLLFHSYQVKPGDFNEVTDLFKKRHSELAAVILEPLIQGACGMRLMPKGYLAHVARLCKEYDVLLIADEVATGFGRTGTMFAVEQENVHPDFLCVAKSLTGGYLPLAATLTKEHIYKAFLGRFEEFKAFFHGHTYTANPLACAVAFANLDLFRKTRLLQNVRARTSELSQGLSSLLKHPHVKEIRQKGLMAGIELVKDRKKGLPYPAAQRMGLRVCDACLKGGVWLRPLGDVVVLMPPLAISAKELNFLINVVTAAIQEVTG